MEESSVELGVEIRVIVFRVDLLLLCVPRLWPTIAKVEVKGIGIITLEIDDER